MDGIRDSLMVKSEIERKIPLISGNQIYGTNEPFYRKETHGLVEQTCGCQEGGGRIGMYWESGVNRCKLLHLE